MHDGHACADDRCGHRIIHLSLRIAHRAVVLHVGKEVANDTAANVAADANLRQYYLGLVE